MKITEEEAKRQLGDIREKRKVPMGQERFQIIKREYRLNPNPGGPKTIIERTWVGDFKPF